mmetsp:Transcript_1979/g.6531  ORF Transcript_1979/g.6531 Transcript_1979/m.6531 type:complete len:275 (-) Transcript_1979:999-1823(-)
MPRVSPLSSLSAPPSPPLRLHAPRASPKARAQTCSGCGIKRRAKQSSPPRVARSGGGDQRRRRLRLERRRLLFPRLALPRLLLRLLGRRLCGGGRRGPLDKDGGEDLEGDLLAHVHPDAARRAAMHHHLVLAGCLGRVERKLARHRRQREGGGERREADQCIVPRGSLHGHIPILADRLADDPPPLLRPGLGGRRASLGAHLPLCGALLGGLVDGMCCGRLAADLESGRLLLRVDVRPVHLRLDRHLAAGPRVGGAHRHLEARQLEPRLEKACA